MFTVDLQDLHTMDLGAHIHLMEEWNEDAGFMWQPAVVVLQGFYTRVFQGDGKGGLHVATYITNGEGDIISLIVYTHRDAIGHEYLGNSLSNHMLNRRQSMQERMEDMERPT